ncbi:hypothetical protein KKG61_08315, partial [bacterium]|nr:hypothetical protein [bacterium]MBU1600086.1 hypothetical protein [bacterium]
MSTYYSRDAMGWGQYLQMNSFVEDITDGLKRSSESVSSAISSNAEKIISANIASQEEIARVTQEGFNALVYSVDRVAEGVEYLRADFNFAMEKVLWKLEMQEEALNGVLKEIRLAEFEREARALRTRAEGSYINGWYDEALLDFLEAEKRNYQDFSVHFSIANIYLYHKIDLEKTLEYYLKSAKYATPKLKEHAAKSYLFAGWTCYLLRKDNEAIDYTTKAIQLNPELSEAYYNKAKYLAGTAQPQLAIESLEKSVSFDRNYCIKAVDDPDFQKIQPNLQEFFQRLYDHAKQKANALMNKYVFLDTAELEKIKKLMAQDTYFAYTDII